MSQRITIDPITRIEGHLRIDCEIEGGVVTKAWSSGTMWRGMEEIVKGNDPRDVWMAQSSQQLREMDTVIQGLKQKLVQKNLFLAKY